MTVQPRHSQTSTPSSVLTHLRLVQFRNYQDAYMDITGPMVLYGPNGAGKTNVLEAISLFSPGRGLRHARLNDIQRTGSALTSPWSVSAGVLCRGETVKIGTGRAVDKDRRLVRIDGQTANGLSALANYLSIIWLTPQMDRLFMEGSAARRKFLDRLVFGFDPAHAGRLTRYDNAMRNRAKILREARDRKISPDAAWLTSLESLMAETGVSIAAARKDLVRRLRQAVQTVVAEHFPLVRLEVEGWVEDRLDDMPAVALEDALKGRLADNRALDQETGVTHIGIHRSDLKCWHGDHDMPADQCSTGEQKALLLGLVLANADVMMAQTGRAPVLLLDEVAAHLDERRRAALYEILLHLGGQFFLTGTDQVLFKPLSDKAQIVSVKNSQFF